MFPAYVHLSGPELARIGADQLMGCLGIILTHSGCGLENDFAARLEKTQRKIGILRARKGKPLVVTSQFKV
jgi:hypothetical protein